MSDFVHLQVHTQYSLLKGAIRVDDLIKKALEYQMPAVAMTDLNNIFGAIEFYNGAVKKKIKPILGVETFLPGTVFTKDVLLKHKNTKGVLKNLSPFFKVSLLVQNLEGYHNLCKLLSHAYLSQKEGAAEVPHISWHMLKKHHSHLFCLLHFSESEAMELLLAQQYEDACASLQPYQELFAERLYLQIARGVSKRIGPREDARIIDFAQENKVPLVAVNDCHYMAADQAFAHQVLEYIGERKILNDIENGDQLINERFFKSPQEMHELFADLPEAISNTVQIAEACNLKLKFTDEKGRQIYHLPAYPTPNGQSEKEYLREASLKGLHERIAKLPYAVDSKVYEERLDYECTVICNMGFEGYFLIVSDFIQWAKTQEIPVGPGRGSGAGSLVAYSLKITDLDPIYYDLLFERFLNPERISMPDFDIDFCYDRRDEVIAYVNHKYGSNKVCQIITFGALLSKGAIRDVGRVLGMPNGDRDALAKMIPLKGPTQPMDLNEALEAEPRLNEMAERDPKIRKLLDTALQIEGLLRNAGMHAAGVIIGSKSIDEFCPLYRGAEGFVVCQFDKDFSEKIGLVKFDFLALKTLTFLNSIQTLVRQRHNPQFKIEDIPTGDAKIYELLMKGDSIGLFQLESDGMQKLLKQAKPDRFEDIIAINALYRPGPINSGMLGDFCDRKQGNAAIVYDFAELENILKETYGIIVYQEQVQRIAVVLAGYSLGQADLLRRAMGKKLPEEMAKQKEVFVNGAVARGHDPQKIEELFDKIAQFAEYGFNKSHAAAYALIAVHTAYLKAHFPLEFFAAILSIEAEDIEKVAFYLQDVKAHGVTILPPDVNESRKQFTIVNQNQIRYGLAAIKGVGSIAIELILQDRQKNGPYLNLVDFVERLDLQKVNRKVIECLIKAGAFDSLSPQASPYYRAFYFEALDQLLQHGDNFHKEAASSQANLFGFSEQAPSPEIHASRTQQTWRDILQQLPAIQPWSSRICLNFEMDTISCYVSGHPIDEFPLKIKCLGVRKVADVKKQMFKGEVCLAGIFSDLRVTVSKEKQQKMALFQFEDDTGSIKGVIFPEAYAALSGEIHLGEATFVRAIADINEDSMQLKLTSPKPQNIRQQNSEGAWEKKTIPILGAEVTRLRRKPLPQPKKIYCRWSVQHYKPEQLFKLRSTFEKFPGTIPVQIKIYDSQAGAEAWFSLPSQQKILFNEESVQQLQDVFAANEMRFVYERDAD